MASLPFAAIEPETETRYKREAASFVAFAAKNNLSVVPCSLRTLSGYLYSKFTAGLTSRSNSSILSRLRWYYKHVLQSPWLTEEDRRTLQAVQTSLRKYDFSIPAKAAPLYKEHLRRLWIFSTKTDGDLVIYTAWMLAHATISRMGELLSKSVKFNCIHWQPVRSLFIFYHHRPPKSHKMKQTPFALITKRNQRLAYFTLVRFVTQFQRKPQQPLFPSVKADKTLGTGSLARDVTVKWLRHYLKELGFPAAHRYSGHSPRRGAFNDAKDRIPMSYIAAQGHWSPGAETAQAEYSVDSISNRIKYF